MADETPAVAPRKAGRPRRIEADAVVLSPEEAARQEFRAFQTEALEYAKDNLGPPCPECGGRKGYNEITGVELVSWHGRHKVEGHRGNCSKNGIPEKGK